MMLNRRTLRRLIESVIQEGKESDHNSSNERNKKIIERIRTEFGNEHAANWTETMLKESDKIQQVKNKSGKNYRVKLEVKYHINHPANEGYRKEKFHISGETLDRKGNRIGSPNVNVVDDLFKKILSSESLNYDQTLVGYDFVGFSGGVSSLDIFYKDNNFIKNSLDKL